MKTKSLWNQYSLHNHYPTLDQDFATDVVVIGGGITGITTAQLLRQSGMNVVVLEARNVSGGTTSHSTGNLYIFDKYITKIFDKHGSNAARKLVASRSQALEFIKNNIQTFDIDCDLQTVPWNAYSSHKDADEKIEKYLKVADSLSLQFQETSLPTTTYKVSKAITLPDQAQFNPALYNQGLAVSIQNKCKIFENSPVLDMHEEKDQITVKTAKGSIICKYVVQATHTPKGIMMVQTLLGPYREYGIACQIKEDHPDGIFWGYYTADDLVSTRTYQRDGKKYLVVVGHPHKVGQSKNNIDEIKKLETFAREHFTVSEISHHWGGQHYRPADFIPYIGKSSHDSNVFIATGFATDGLTYGTVAAHLIKDEIHNVKNSLSEIVTPSRFTPFTSGPKFIKENINVIKQYIKDLPQKVEAKSFSEISMGEGKIIELDGQKLAVHRDDKHQLHICSAVCTHMQCIVSWNNAERSWDCPCHGSRFDTEGQVLEGPAISPLEKAIFNQKHIQFEERL